MTDERMDARLRAAGEAWRAETESTALRESTAPDLTRPAPVIPARTHRRHRVTLLASAAVVAAALVAGGAYVLGRTTGGHPTGPAADTALEGTVWRLVGYDGDQRRPDSLATLAIGRDGRLVADDSCSLLTGKVAVDGDRLRVPGLDVRDYNCTDAVGEVTFDRGRDVLSGGGTWGIAGDELTIRGASRTLHLAAAPNLPAPTADRPTYTDATWALTKVVDGAGAQQDVPGAATLRIAGGKLVASDTCNTLSGSVRLDGTTLRTDGGLAQTAMACPGNRTQHTVDGVIADGAVLDLRGPTLTVTKAGSGTLTYLWKPADEQATDPARLYATAWRLQSVGGDPARPGATLRITKDGALTFTASCETVSAQASVRPGSFVATGVPEASGAGCPPELTTAHSLLAVAGGPVLWRIDGDRLVLNDSGVQGFALVFAPLDASTASPGSGAPNTESPSSGAPNTESPNSGAPNTGAPGTAAELQNFTWRLTSVEQSDATSGSGHSVTDGATLRLDRAGTFTLAERCRQVSGRAGVADRRITFTDVRTIEHSCPPPADATGKQAEADDQAVADLLARGAATWTVHDGQLELTGDGVTLTFAR